ncbi:MAG: GAF domain-containing sensor histidine kinase, partial [Chloroflexota bacterium]
VANIVVLLLRFVRMPRSYVRQQLLILLSFTVLAIVPGQLLTFYPWLLFDSPVLSWALSNLLLALIPLGYAFVIFRRNYLRLDLFMTNTLALLLVVGLLSAVYSATVHLLRSQQLLQVEGLPPGLIIVPLLLAVPYASRPVRRAVQVVLYGHRDVYGQRLAAFTATLSANPQPSNLDAVVRQTMALLQIRQGALLLTDAQGLLVLAFNYRVDGLGPIAVREVQLLPESRPYLAQNQELSGLHPVVGELPWVHVALPLAAREQLVGLLLLGRPVPDGYLNGQELAFLRQLADTMAVAALNVQLFEATRAMARKLLRVRDAERLKLASQIHDDPLQRVSWVAGELRRLAGERRGEEAALLERHSLELLSVAAQLRETSAGLFPPMRQQGVQWAVRDAVHHMRQQEGCEVHLEITLARDVVATDEVAASVYHVLRESLNNIRKHAGARNVWVRLFESEGALQLTVEDDGCAGEEVFMSVPDLLRSHHFGLAGMHEWAGMAGGKLTLQRRDGGGTCVRLTIPSLWRAG